MNDEKIETVKINANNIEKNLDNEHLNTSQQLQNNITTDNNLEIMDFDLDEENTTTKAIKDKNSFTPTTYASNYDTYIKVVALAFAEGGGKDVISVISAKNQYAGYNNNNYKKIIGAFKNGNINDYLSDEQLIAIYNLLDNDTRTTSCNSFRGNGKTNKFYNM